MRQIIIIGAILCSVILIIPTMLVLAFQGNETDKSIKSVSVQTSNTINSTSEGMDLPEDLTVAVFRSKTQKIEEFDFEDYIIGVVASEMPAEFSIEALKAQALTARTYIIKHMLNPSEINIPKGAQVTDTVQHQVFRSDADLREFWGKDYDWAKAKVTEAVRATRGQIITYEGSPITASFFSTSNGYTENSEDYWPNKFSYLRSVESPWDSESPRYKTEKTITSQEFFNALGVKLPGDGTVGEITSRTQGGRVAKVEVNGKTFTGRDIREKLDLDSSDFQWKRSGNNVVIQTKGWGHGVGMSQWGAEGMAKEGKSYQEIIKYYYNGVQISSIDPFIANVTAKK
jgi:stage II sporulation protein D